MTRQNIIKYATACKEAYALGNQKPIGSILDIQEKLQTL